MKGSNAKGDKRQIYTCAFSAETPLHPGLHQLAKFHKSKRNKLHSKSVSKFGFQYTTPYTRQFARLVLKISQNEYIWFCIEALHLFLDVIGLSF